MSTGVVVPEQEPDPTPKANKEATAIASGNLKRGEAVKTHIHWAGLTILWSAVTMGLILAVAWVFHLVTPDKWHFLSIEQRTDIQTVLLSALGSSFATTMAKKWIDPNNNNSGESPES
jgi:hypothetical protein